MDMNEVRNELQKSYGTGYNDGYSKGYDDGCADRKECEWIVYDSDSDIYDDIRCPRCKKRFTVDAYRKDDIGFTITDLKFCPNCGAKMKGAVE